MAIELEDEHELGERVKTWLRENGSTMITGVALGVAGIFGWNWWQAAKVEHRITAATQFEALTDAVAADDVDSVASLAASLSEGYRDTGYAALGQLRLADLRAARGESDAARDALVAAEGMVKNDPATAALIAIRLARIDLAAGRSQAALDRLERVDPTFAAVASQLRGDALRDLNRTEEARAAYREALTLLDASAAPQREIIERKLAQLSIALAPEA
jgi:predicted negative regulator of RcsB-dependent stress response